ncbi:MAG: Gfo/Idh/MocA family protein [Puniceicoccaceae bacterium]
MKSFNWGILGCGSIAHRFAKSMKPVSGGHLLACASRTQGRASSFAEEHSIPQAYTSYEELAADPRIDAIYVATTHNFHCENTLLALEHGKHVLCEKPLATNAREASQMIELARQKNLFLMEAMWTRFLPAIQEAKARISAGSIGTLKCLRADFCIRAPFDPNGRLFNPDLAGGALLDTGIYPLSLASYFFGAPPKSLTALADIGSTGVDEQTAIILKYEQHQIAILSASVSSASANRAEIVGTKGRLTIPVNFLSAREFVIALEGDSPTQFNFPFDDATAFSFEIEEVHRCLREGLLESPTMPLGETLQLAETMDRVLELVK